MATYPTGAFISSPCFAFVESPLHQRGQSSVSNSPSIALDYTAGGYAKWRGIIHGKWGLEIWDPDHPRALPRTTLGHDVTLDVDGDRYITGTVGAYLAAPNAKAFQRLVFESTTTPDPATGTGSSTVRLTYQLRDRRYQGVRIGGAADLFFTPGVAATMEVVTGSGYQLWEAGDMVYGSASLTTTDSGSSVETTETITAERVDFIGSSSVFVRSGETYTSVNKTTASDEYTEADFMDDAVALWALMPAVEVEQDTSDSYPAGYANWGLSGSSIVPVFQYWATLFNLNDHVKEPMPTGSSGSIAVGAIRTWATREDLTNCYPASGTWVSGSATGYYSDGTTGWTDFATGLDPHVYQINSAAQFTIAKTQGGELYASHGVFRVKNVQTALFIRTSAVADDATLTRESKIQPYAADTVVVVPEGLVTLTLPSDLITASTQYKLDYESAWNSPVIDYPDPTP